MTGNESTQPPDEKEVLEFVAYATGSKYRLLIFEQLAEGPKHPSDIADAGDVARSHVSRALKQLRARELVQSYGANSRSKLYVLTDLGKNVNKKISNNDL